MNLRELINHMVFRNNKYEIVKNNFLKQYFPDVQLQFTFEYIIYHKLSSTNDFNFIQIGANDGERSDPIWPFVKKNLISGILLEPVKYYFDKLQKNYEDNKNVKLVNKAIHRSKKEEIIYKINEESIGKDGIPLWAKGISTFDKKRMEKHCKDIPNYSEHLVEEKVSCISWKDLIHEYEIKKLDLLQIDTEGFDYEVNKMVDFSEIKPAIIRFEHAHLTDKDLHECMGLLINNGYKLFCETGDTTAYLE